MPKSSAHHEPSGWVLYDGACGFCSRWVPRWRRILHARDLSYAALQEDWVREKTGMDEAELVDDIRLLLASGEMYSGPEVYRYVMRRTWWLWPVWLVSVIPLGRQVFDWAYRTFARNRYRVSRACGLADNGASR